MKNNVVSNTSNRANNDSNLVKKNEIKEEFNSRNYNRKINIFLLFLIIILIIIIIIFFFLFLSRGREHKNISINKTQIVNKKIICKSGFYLPIDDPLEKNCRKCSIENCIECYGSKQKDICIKCNPDLRGIYINNKIESCEIPCEEGINDKCKKCFKYTNICLSCNDGYYLPEFGENICQKCSINNCLECYGNKTSNNCTKYNSNLQEVYESFTNKTIISCRLSCEVGCKRCLNIRNGCIECDSGY